MRRRPLRASSTSCTSTSAPQRSQIRLTFLSHDLTTVAEMEPMGSMAEATRSSRRVRRRRFSALAALSVTVLLAPAVYSYATTMMQPSSLPLWPRSVEWLRAHHGNWLVDEVEHYYYSWKAPDPGGPQLKRLPTVGSARPDGHDGAAPPRGSAAAGSRPCSRTRCPARACGEAPGPLVAAARRCS